jgi:hypothetical protein
LKYKENIGKSFCRASGLSPNALQKRGGMMKIMLLPDHCQHTTGRYILLFQKV